MRYESRITASASLVLVFLRCAFWEISRMFFAIFVILLHVSLLSYSSLESKNGTDGLLISFFKILKITHPTFFFKL